MMGRPTKTGENHIFKKLFDRRSINSIAVDKFDKIDNFKFNKYSRYALLS